MLGAKIFSSCDTIECCIHIFVSEAQNVREHRRSSYTTLYVDPKQVRQRDFGTLSSTKCNLGCSRLIPKFMRLHAKKSFP